MASHGSNHFNPAELGARVDAHGAGECRLETLRRAPELERWPRSQLGSLLPYVDEVAVPKGRVLAAAGQPCSQFLIVAEGRLIATSPAGEHRCLEVGDSSGWTAMWERSLNQVTLVADSDARLLVMGHAQFRAVRALVGHPGEPQRQSRPLPWLRRLLRAQGAA